MTSQPAISCPLDFLVSTLILKAPDPSSDPSGFFAAFCSLGWRLRKTSHTINPSELAQLKQAGISDPESLSLTELARVALLCRGLATTPMEQHLPLLLELFRTGDNAEREAILKTLILLPAPGRFLDIALDGCRSSVQTTVEAITLDNVYPSRYFPAESYRGMVLKALHLGLPLTRIDGLADHLDEELIRMAEAYASERRAAGRTIPADFELLTLRSPSSCT
jgi:hypothetical protein